MKWNKGRPEKSGEYFVVMATAAGPQVDIVNFGATDAFPAKDYYYAGEEGPIVIDNVLAWAELPDVSEFEEVR